MKKTLGILLIFASTLSPTPLLAEPDKGQVEAEDSLRKAQQHFLEALKALGEAGRKSYDKHLPQLKEQSEEALEKSRSLLEKWRDQLEEELDEQLEKQRKHDREENRHPPRPLDDKDSTPLI